MQSRRNKQASPCGDNGVRIIVDEEITLRDMLETDAESVFQVVDSNRNHLRKWLSWVDSATNVESSRIFIAERREQIRLGTGLTLCIERRGRIVGVVGFRDIDQSDRSASIGYWLAAGVQGKGVVTRSCQKLIEYGIDSLGLHRFRLRAAKANRKSRNIAERLGFVKVGVMNQPQPSSNPDFDLVAYSLNAADWRSRMNQFSLSE